MLGENKGIMVVEGKIVYSDCTDETENLTTEDTEVHRGKPIKSKKNWDKS